MAIRVIMFNGRMEKICDTIHPFNDYSLGHMFPEHGQLFTDYNYTPVRKVLPIPAPAYSSVRRYYKTDSRETICYAFYIDLEE